MKQNKTLKIEINMEIFDHLCLKAKQNNQSPSQYVRHLINQDLKK